MIETIIIANLIATFIVLIAQARHSDQTDRLITLMESHLNLESENKNEIEKLQLKNIQQDREIDKLRVG